jgi:hypothetical protein
VLLWRGLGSNWRGWDRTGGGWDRTGVSKKGLQFMKEKGECPKIVAANCKKRDRSIFFNESCGNAKIKEEMVFIQ